MKRLLLFSVLLGLFLPAQTQAIKPLSVGYNDLYMLGHGLGAAASQDATWNKRCGSSVVRLPIDWATVEPQQGTFYFQYVKDMAAGLRAQGVKLLPIIHTSPQWARPSTPNRFAPPDSAYELYLGRFAQKLAQAVPDAAAIEVWNEPNLAYFWGNQPIDPVRYTRLLKQAYTEIRKVSNVPILGGAVSNNGVTGNGNMAMVEFLSGMYAAGAGSYMTYLSFHPYPYTADLALFYRNVNEARQAAARRNKLWISEIGMRVSQFGEQGQANGLLKMLRYARDSSDIKGYDIHTLIYSDWAVIRNDGSSRPACIYIFLEPKS